ncbi:hypothetical protein OC725_00960 ['Bituminaria bituminosa' little leaf phytoplasma]|uniref:Effector n=2 Tax=Candidatus Phytoplasma fabacearum TaxID=2982628 RepID=A0ABU8ZS93_9MOLU|nr:hypothetical protein [Pigeon pea little leaf phytoplasma]
MNMLPLLFLLYYVVFSKNNILLAHNSQNYELDSKTVVLLDQNIPNLSSNKQKLESLQQLFIQNNSLINCKLTLNEEPDPISEFEVCCSSLDYLCQINQKFYTDPADCDKLSEMTEKLKDTVKSRIYSKSSFSQSSLLKVHNLNDTDLKNQLLSSCSAFIIESLTESICYFNFGMLCRFALQTPGIVACIISNNY